MSAPSQQPFFSVVIPSKGRADLLRDALRSVLYQEFTDYEVVVSDNCNDARTKEVIELFAGNPHLVYVRPDVELSMPEHWEFATRNAKGKYVLVLTDRSVLTQHALAKLHQVLVDNPEIDLCSWNWSCFIDGERRLMPARSSKPSRAHAHVLTTGFVANAYAKESIRGKYHSALPRGLNSLYRADLAERVRSEHGALFHAINPDYSSAFLLLAYGSKLIYIDESIFVSQGLSVSNGGNAVISTEGASRYLRTLGSADFFVNVPIKEPIVENSIASDFLRIKSITYGTLSAIELDWAQYFVGCYLEIRVKKDAGVMSAAEVERLMAVWRNACASFGPEIQRTVARKIRSLELRRVVRKTRIGRMLISAMRHATRLRRLGRGRERYASVMEAAGFATNAQ